MNNDDDVYIQLLREARSQLSTEGITWDEFKAKIRSAKLGQHRERLFVKIYDQHPSRQLGGKVHMGIEAYMWLLQYEEFHHALEESKQARKEAGLALSVAVYGIAIGVVIGLGQLFLQVMDMVIKNSR
jgi:hypothetical protein